MPKSKRNRVVPLSKVLSKKGVTDRKIQLANKVKKFLSEYNNCFVFTYKNMTNMSMNALKEYFKDSNSIFVLGKNRVCKKALEENIKNNSSQLSQFLKGNCGLFFTNLDPEKIIDYFEHYSCPYFGNVGTISNQTVILKKGYNQMMDQFPSSMESQFRQLGLKIKLDNERFVMLDDFIVCEDGKPLNADQSKMIKHLGIEMDEFKIKLQAYLGAKSDFHPLNS